MSRIAVVDDEKSIRELIRMALEQEGHEVCEYADGLEALEGFQGAGPDLIILDILMPRMDGLELCRKVRALPWGKTAPIIFLSSRDEEIDKILGLESGADDYVSKPFSLRELLARIRAGLRRTGGQGLAAAPFVRGDLILDENRYAAFWKNQPLELTVTEFRILQSLTAHPGFIKTREQLMAAAFPEDNFPNDKAADSHIKRIRRKFLALDADFSRLESVYGLGFRWREAAAGGEQP
ncbi:MAG: response regulator transcription factor [Treponema sp.]|jgi:two-component system response regulator ChvI|nr:response regulator transcription factor [Treponema sp.]